MESEVIRLIIFVPIAIISMLAACITIECRAPEENEVSIRISNNYHIYLKYQSSPIELFKTNDQYYQVAIIFGMVLSYAFSLGNIEYGFFTNILIFLIVAIIFYPLFICFSNRNKLITQIMGIIYCVLIIIDYGFICIEEGLMRTLMYITQPICATLIIFYFSAIMIVRSSDNSPREFIRIKINKEIDYIYVKNLLNKKKKEDVKNFRYPPRLIFSMLITLIIAYMILIYFIFHVSNTMIKICDNMEWVGCTSEQAKKFSTAISIIVPPASLAYLIAQIWLLMCNYHKDMMLLRKGKKDRIPQGIVAGDVLNFIGYQIGYGLFGFILLIGNVILICWILFIIFVNNHLWEAIKNYTFIGQLTWPTVYTVISGISVVVGTTRALVLSSFLIRYLGIFNHIEYIFMFINLFRGLIVFIWCKILVPLAVIAFTSFRIDKTVSDRVDFGYKSYIAMLLADHEYNNPIKNIFISLMNPEPELLKPIYSSERAARAAKKWFLFYTLINNPSIKKTRKHRMTNHIVVPIDIE